MFIDDVMVIKANDVVRYNVVSSNQFVVVYCLLLLLKFNSPDGVLGKLCHVLYKYKFLQNGLVLDSTDPAAWFTYIKVFQELEIKTL